MNKSNIIRCKLYHARRNKDEFNYDKLVLKRFRKVLNFTQKLGNGDLSEELSFRGNDDISKLGESLNKASSNIKLLLSDIMETSKNINDSSHQLLEATKSKCIY